MGLNGDTYIYMCIYIHGEYRTACAKEYPSRLKQSFALAIMAKLEMRKISTEIPDTYGKFLAERSACTECGVPDYQPL